jgi:hypothetical protein
VLLQHGAAPNVVGGFTNCSPLMLAVESRHPAVVAVLLESGRVALKEVQNALAKAKQHGRQQSVALLEAALAKMTAAGNK